MAFPVFNRPRNPSRAIAGEVALDRAVDSPIALDEEAPANGLRHDRREQDDENRDFHGWISTNERFYG